MQPNEIMDTPPIVREINERQLRNKANVLILSNAEFSKVQLTLIYVQCRSVRRVTKNK